ncbi:MAG: pyridoxal-dependent decarboxylase [Bacteroidales bacterium]|nr:pyridoxal-dependent decarboxylase [Bacteroidales bacterium]
MNTLQTPYFLIDKEELDKNIVELKQALIEGWGNYKIGYSFKTNSLPWIINHLKQHGCFAEVVSSDEYNLALHMGYDPTKIIFNGPVKGKQEFDEAVLKGAIVNIDSRREIDWLRMLDDSSLVNIGIRVNVDLKNIPDETDYFDEGSRFGFCPVNGDLYQIVAELESLGNVKIQGLHLHLGSRTRGLKVYKELARLACEIKRKTSIKFSYVDVGGGFFGGLPTKPSFKEYVETIATELRQEFSPDETALIMEPGAAIIASPISFVTSVVDVRNTNKSTIVTLDGSRINIDPLMTKDNYFYNIDSASDDIIKKQIIVGFTCMEKDRIINIYDKPGLQIGDKITFEKVGSYTMALNPLFIQYYPSVYVKVRKGHKLVRERWNVEDYVQKQSW